MLTFKALGRMTPKEWGALNATDFGTLLDSVPEKERMKTWTKITPLTLYYLSEEAMEALLDRLPQCGAIAGRERGKLRVQSLGFNVHIAGTDRRAPYPIDFCVRINGYQAAVNILIQVKPEKFSLAFLEGLPVGPALRFTDAIKRLCERGISSLADFEIALLRMYRPACPGGYQYGTAGGAFEGPEDTAKERSLRETRQEFKGFEYLAWELMLNEEIYQSGNVYELQNAGAVLGYMPDRSTVATEKSEAIEDWVTVPLNEIFDFFDRLRRVPATDPACIRHDSKIDHALCVIIPRMAKCGIRVQR